MRLTILSILVLLFINSCINNTATPDKVSNRVDLSELLLETDFTNVHTVEPTIKTELLELSDILNLYKSQNVNYNLRVFEESWDKVAEEINRNDWKESDLIYWAEITGLLLEITGYAKYAEELENLSKKESMGLQKVIAPFIMSKHLDHIYINIFEPVEINYLHSMKGEVKIRQETDYPNSGSVQLHFGMTERRHIELFIRIPSWAEGTTVIVKQVKYFASPGSYCKIVKKWKEGDLVEIEFPISKLPR